MNPKDQNISLEFIAKVRSIKYHRNGVSGAGFHLVRFTHEPDKHNVRDTIPGEREFVGIVFEEPSHVAVIALDNLEDRWRGDRFEKDLRDSIKVFEEMEDEFGRSKVDVSPDGILVKPKV